MNEQHKIDPFDEALRILWLEGLDELNNEDSQKKLNSILSGNYSVTMSQFKSTELIDKLHNTVQSSSLGQLINQAIVSNKLSEEEVVKQSQLPLKTFSELKTDSIFPNNIPILLLRNLLKQLNISYKVAEQAIFKSFDTMKNREFIASCVSQPTFRRSQTNTRDSFLKVNHKADGRELFENEEALKKYLLKLEELMK